MGLRDFAWDSGFPSLGIKTTLICLQLMGIYPKAKRALSSVISLGAGDWIVCRPSGCLVDGSVRGHLRITSRPLVEVFK
jgi:hypothetical protein